MLFKNKLSLRKKGVIEPNSIKEVTIKAESVQLGDITSNLMIKINGSVEAPIRCTFMCFSQGPVVQIHPKTVDWGLTTVLTDSSRELTISNESLIEAKFTSSMSKRNSAWRLEPPSGIVAPGAEITVKAICYLIDKAKYIKLIVVVEKIENFC